MALALVVPLLGTSAGAGASGTDCTVYTYDNAIEVAGFYMYGTAHEVWEESNGIAGLQRTHSYCASGGPLPPDTCIKHSENGALVACALGYATSASP